MNQKKFYDIAEVADRIGLSIHTVRSLIKKETLKAVKLTNKWYIHDLEVIRFLTEAEKAMVKTKAGIYSEEDSMMLNSCQNENI